MYYTQNYDDWLELIDKNEPSNFIGETKTFVELECFKKLTHFMYMPAAKVYNRPYFAKTIVFKSVTEIEEFLIDNPRFMLFRCIHLVNKDHNIFLLRGVII